MQNRSGTVDAFMAALEHPLRDSVDRLRLAILAGNPGLTEQIKWKAPSFVYAGDDRVTFNLRPQDKIQLILHRGAQVRGDVHEFSFTDASGLVSWITPDRGTVTFADAAEARARESDLVRLVAAWIEA